jgi:heme/copper-type cytochrome/quinol oxidase subunit 4
MSAGAVRIPRWQLTVALVVSLILEVVGFVMVATTSGDMRVFGWLIVVLGALFTGINFAMRKMQ